MNAVFFGNDGFALPTLEALSRGHTLLAVVTAPDRPRGRGHRVAPAPIKEWAVAHRAPVFQPERLDPATVCLIRNLKPDLLVVIAYGKLLPRSLLAAARLGALNVHPSLLPAYRGAAPMEWALLNGERRTGISIIAMEPGLDTGPVFCREELPLGENETIVSLRARVAERSPALLLEAARMLADGKRPEPQAGVPTYARKLVKEDGIVDWKLPAGRIHNLVRGTLMWPGALTHLPTPKGRRLLKLRETAVAEKTGSRGKPGEVLAAGAGRLLVACGGGALAVARLQLEGKAELPADAFLRGCRIAPGTLLDGE